MKKNYICFLNTKIQEIDFKKIGIRIRNINTEEIECIKKKIESIYCSKAIMDLLRRYQKAQNIDKAENNIDIIQDAIKTYKEIENLSNDYKEVFFYLRENKGGINKRIIKENLKNCIIVEIDEDIYKKCFATWNVKSVISRIINFANYLGNKYEPMNFEITDITNINNYSQIVNNYEYSKFDGEILEKIVQILNNKDVNFNTNFVFMIDTFIIKDMDFESKIIKMIAIIEKVLIDKEEKKQSEFILKVGVLIHNDVEWEYDRISKILKLVYETRSFLVHGNDDDLYSKKISYAKIFEIENLEEITEKIEVRYQILLSVSNYLERITKLVLNKYFENVSFCDFLKSN